MRWVEAAAFTMVMRTHEGNRPDDNWHFDSDTDTLKHLAKMVAVHEKLKSYLQTLSREYEQKGTPPIRACYLHYPNDKVVHQLKYQYLLGQDLLVAPVIKKNRRTWIVYLPEDEWIHLWSDENYTGPLWLEIELLSWAIEYCHAYCAEVFVT